MSEIKHRKLTPHDLKQIEPGLTYAGICVILSQDGPQTELPYYGTPRRILTPEEFKRRQDRAYSSRETFSHGRQRGWIKHSPEWSILAGRLLTEFPSVSSLEEDAFNQLVNKSQGSIILARRIIRATNC